MNAISRPAHPLLSVIVLLMVACTGGRVATQDSSAFARASSRPFDTPLAWTVDDSAVVVMRLAYQSAPNAREVDCSITGLFLVTPRGRERLLSREDDVCQLVWRAQQSSQRLALSPDMVSVAYANPFRNGAITLYSLRDHAERVVIEDCLPTTSAPAWSPDGRRLAYSASCDEKVPPFLHSADVAGQSRDQRPASTQSQAEDFPTWAPDGRVLAYTVGERRGTASIALLDLVTKARRRIAAGSEPAWNPKGAWIAYLYSDRRGAPPELRVVRPDGTGQRTLIASSDTADSTHAVRGPLVWSRDGARVAFARGGDVAIVDTTGKLSAALPR